MGFEIAEDLVQNYKNISAHKNTKQWGIYRIADDESGCSLEKEGDKGSSIEEFRNALPDDEPRLGVFLLEWKSDDGVMKSKICFVMYAPDTCKVLAQKFKYANFKEQVKQKMNPNREFQINDKADIKSADWEAEF